MEIKYELWQDLKWLDSLTHLFDQYRIFYEQTSDLEAARSFLKLHFEHKTSRIILAFDDEKPAGFTQLYPSFSSVSMQPLWILNDLFVLPVHRGKGIGRGLLSEAQAYCKLQNAKGLALETARDNPAQRLYEQLGWEKDDDFLHYFWSNPRK